MKKPILLALITGSLFSSCQKNESPSPDSTKNVSGIKSQNLATINADVYVAGDYQLPSVGGVPQFAVAYWKNGAAVTLPSTAGNGTSHAQAIAVSGTDVYVAGYDHGTSTSAAATSGVPCIWKNGVEQQLPIPVGGYTGEATSITVSGTDVYVVGYFVTNDAVLNRRAVMWKNGVATMIAFNKFDSIATGIALDGTDVYISGNATFNGVTCAVYWKNNVWHSFAGTTVTSRTSGIAVDALHNYYISGASNGQACYWKDANIKLLSTNDYDAPVNAQSELLCSNNITTSNNNVYVCGVDVPELATPPDPDDPNPGLQVAAVYWKNGQEVFVSGQYEHGGPSGIAVISDQAYTAGAFNSGTYPFYTVGQSSVTSINNIGIPYGISTIRGIAVVQH